MAESELSQLERTATDRAIRPPLASYQPLVVAAVALAVGIAADRFAPWSHLFDRFGERFAFCTALWLVSAGCLGVWFSLWARHRHEISNVFLLLAIATTGAAWHHGAWNNFDQREFARFAAVRGEPICLLAVAQQRPLRLPAPPASVFRAIPRGEHTRLAVNVLAIRDGTTWARTAGRCDVRVDGHLLGIRAGDQLRIFGTLQRITAAMNPGDFDFSLAARAQRRLAGVLAPSPDCVQLVTVASDWQIPRLFDAIRRRCEEFIWKYVDARRAPLAVAILLGQREALTRDQTMDYLLTGTIHVLVVSGLHVGIMVAALYVAMRWGLMPRRATLLTVMLLVVFYTMLVGAKPPVVRAAVLAILMCLAAWTGRRALSTNSLAAAAIVVLALNPAELFQIGPQLSFLAVATLVWIGDSVRHQRNETELDPLQMLIEQARPWHARLLRGVVRTNGWLLVATTAVWLAALPLVMFRFHVLAPVAVLISPFIWPLVSFALFSGFGLLVCGWLLPPAADYCGHGCDTALLGLESLVQFASDLPLAHFWVPGPAGWWVVGLYTIVLLTRALNRRIIPLRWQVGLLCSWILVGVLPKLAGTGKVSDFRCTFLAVGHGQCVVMHVPGGKTLLYDAGSLASPDVAARSVSNYLWYHGLRRIDGMVLSHADVDHFNAMPALTERFDVGTVFVSPLMFDGFGNSATASSAPAKLEQLLQDRGIPVREIVAGDRLRFGDEVKVDVLHPPRHGMYASDNADSITLAVEHRGCRLVLPGDLESPGLEAVLAELPYDCDVLLAPHHGSPRSDPPGFAAWCTPEWVIVSGSGGDEVNKVAETYRTSGAVVRRTDHHGAIQIRVNSAEQILVTTYCP